MSCRNLSTKIFFSFSKVIALPLFFCFWFSYSIKAQQVAEVITDFGGFWKSGISALNATYPNNSHNVLSFKYNSVVYSTGVNDTKLNANSITYTSGDFRAFPIGTVGGTVTSGASIFIALASQYDGVPNGYSNPLPSLKIKNVLIDGIHGLDLGTGATNIPASALINFPISTVIASSISDAKPDILVSQIASPSSNGDTLYFVNSAGVVVGNKVSINWNLISKLGTYYLDLYTLPNGALCDTAKINGTSDKETTRDIRLIAFTLADFGITTINSSTITGFVLKASGTSDPAFIAYNADAFTIPAPVITIHPATQIICPNVSNSATFSVTATGGSLSYQWRKNNVDIPGATAATYTITNVNTASSGAYNVIVSNPVGSVASNMAYLNISVTVQPSPTSQVIATGASCVLSVSVNNATGYQWIKGNTDITGATSATYTVPVNNADTSNYSVRLINAAGAGCANISSNSAIVIGSRILYSKTGVNLNFPGSWGVAADGSGSSPIDFTRPEHVFIVKSNAVTGANLTISGTLDLSNAVTTISPNTTLDARRIIRSGSGSLSSSSTSSLAVRDTSVLYFQNGNEIIKNLTISNGYVDLLTPLSVTAGSSPGTVLLNAGTFNTNGNLTFKSNSAGTSRLAAVGNAAVISGNVTIERYIPAARGWRLLSVPIAATGAPTINAAWQEAATTASAIQNPNPGYGGKITGGTVANGFDQSPTNNPSIKIFDNTSNTFVRLPASTGTNIPITNYPAYFLYLRGDRSINLMQGLNAAITSTTLRMKGTLKTGNQVNNINASGYTLVPNPYPSAIDFATLTKSNVSNTMYIWDPKMAGTFGLGGYVTISWNSTTRTYDKTTSVSPVSQHIQSGEAFMVTSANHVNPGTLTVKETDKTSGGNDLVFRSASADQELRVDLYSTDSIDFSSLLDGVLTTYAPENVNAVDNDDATKLYGSNQSINIKRDGQSLAIERRKTITRTDTSFLNLYQMKLHDYFLEITADNFQNSMAVLKDNYSALTNNFPLNMSGITRVAFTVNNDPASYAVDRFSIVFENLGPLPVTYTSVKAVKSDKNVLVGWATENELSINRYAIERSDDGVNFTIAGTIPAKGNNLSSAGYSWIDRNVNRGIHYYRIKSTNLNNQQYCSAVAAVSLNETDDAVGLITYPNPIQDNIVFIQIPLLEKGNYYVSISNTNGQMIKKLPLRHGGGIFQSNISLDAALPPGKYQLKLHGADTTFTSSFIKQ